ncbi:hypothetical protein [Acetobacter estunensis]|uniref:hypothetical protein n=1 Tax=Acetobacter estunensis TaxID=104097 RepID=UPI001887CE80|nr:hypothetical protein [Acetobacter estunensis]
MMRSRVLSACFGLAMMACASVAVPSSFTVMSVAHAAPACRDAKGKFTKCPPPRPPRCRDERGKFTRCK